MWSNLDKTITDFILAFEQTLGELDPQLKKSIPLDNLQVIPIPYEASYNGSYHINQLGSLWVVRSSLISKRAKLS